MRHASSRCTLEVYSQARIRAKREAQERIAQMIISDDVEASRPQIYGGNSDSEDGGHLLNG
jgi:hypothetical protein